MATHVLTRTDVRGLTGDLRAQLVRPDPAGAGVADAALEIVAAVRARGDAAVRELTERFDGCRLDDFAVGAAERDAALARLDPDLRAALEFARDQIVAWHEAQREKEAHHERSGIRVRELVVPVDRAGCYVPGGRAPLASSVLMTAIPARVAGVPEVVVCSPPRADGTVDDTVLAAAALAGVDEMYRIGGAQAIAALAYGTESIRAVDVIVGPGNAYVAEAKRAGRADRRDRRVRGPVRSRDRRRRDRRPRAGSRPTSSRRPSTDPVARSPSITWDAAVADAVDARARRAARDARAGTTTRPRRSRRAAASCSSTARTRRWTPPTRSRPSTSSSCARTPRCSSRSSATPARCSSAPTRPR